MARPRLDGRWRGAGLSRCGPRCRRWRRRCCRRRRWRTAGSRACCWWGSGLGCGRCRRGCCLAPPGCRRGTGSRGGRRQQGGPNRGGRQGQSRLRWTERQAGRQPWRPWHRAGAAAPNAGGRWPSRWLTTGGRSFFRHRRFRRSDGGAKAGSVWGGRHRLACVCPILHGCVPLAEMRHLLRRPEGKKKACRPHVPVRHCSTRDIWGKHGVQPTTWCKRRQRVDTTRAGRCFCSGRHAAAAAPALAASCSQSPATAVTLPPSTCRTGCSLARRAAGHRRGLRRVSPCNAFDRSTAILVGGAQGWRRPDWSRHPVEAGKIAGPTPTGRSHSDIIAVRGH
jgi:hypothetical protein